MNKQKFTVGNIVRVLSDVDNYREAGEIGVIISHNTCEPFLYSVEFETKNREGCCVNMFYESEIELANTIFSTNQPSTQSSKNNFIEIDDGIYLNKDKVVWFSIKSIAWITIAGNEELFNILFNYGVDNTSSKKYNSKQEAISDLIKWGFIDG